MAKPPTETVASLIKRGTPSAWPHELTLSMDPKDPLCDHERLELEITDERLINFAAQGQVQPVLIAIRDGQPVVAAGRQRWKRATVINHLVGVHAYDGSLKSVRDAIARLNGSDVAREIVAYCPKGMKLQFALHRGSSADAVHASTSENEHRDDDPLSVKIARAQRLARAGFTAEEQAADMGVSVATMKRWLAADLEKRPAKRPTRGKAARPPAKKIKAMIERFDRGVMHVSAIWALRWANGEVTEQELLHQFPQLAKREEAA